MIDKIKDQLIMMQQEEINGYVIYKKLAHKVKDEHNKKILLKISEDELKHYNELKELTNKTLKPQKLKVLFHYWISIFFGITFGIKLLENGEEKAQLSYEELKEHTDILDKIISDEEQHERELIDMINEEKLNYVGSVVLGLNDALVELTGALAGYTFAFQDTKIIALTGLITGVSASFSMAASEYLSTSHESEKEVALKASVYTGLAYIFTVVFLITPFLILTNPFISLIVSLVTALIIIFVFNYYVSVAKDYNFKKRFTEMSVISLGVAFISFIIGILVKQVFGI